MDMTFTSVWLSVCLLAGQNENSNPYVNYTVSQKSAALTDGDNFVKI